MRSSLYANVTRPSRPPTSPTPACRAAQPAGGAHASAGRLLGVLFVESPNDLQFSFEDEDMLVAMAGHLGAAIDLMQAGPSWPSRPLPRRGALRPATGAPCGAPLPGQRQRVHQRHLPHQGRGGRHLLEAAAGLPAARPHRIQQPRAAAGPFHRPARRQPTTWRRACCCCSAGWSSTTLSCASRKPGAGASACAVLRPVECCRKAGLSHQPRQHPAGPGCGPACPTHGCPGAGAPCPARVKRLPVRGPACRPAGPCARRGS
jgi:hypothetical protein